MGRRDETPFVLPAVAAGVVCGVTLEQFPFVLLVGVCVGVVLWRTRTFRFKKSVCGFCCGVVAGFVRVRLGVFLPTITVVNPFLAIRAAVDEHIRVVVAGAPEQALLSGLLFGGGSGFTHEWKKFFRLTGTSHLIAVSGMNVTFVVVGIEWCVSRVRLYPRQRFTVILACIMAYVAATGAPASVVRAALMAGVAHMAPRIGKFSCALHALSCAVAVMCVFQPAVVYDVGFQLSCLATLGLVTDGLRAEDDSHSSNKIARAFAGVLRATISATLWTLPVSGAVFGAVSAVALISNTIIVPTIPLTTLWGFAVVAGAFVWPAGARIAALPLQWILSGILFVIHSLALMNGSALTVHTSPMLFVMWYGVLCMMLVFRLHRACVAELSTP